MPHYTCSSDYCRAYAEGGMWDADVTWPVRLRRWWERRRDPRPAATRGTGGPDVDLLWAHLERAFRLYGVADERPDPGLTRLVADSLVETVRARLAEIDDVRQREALDAAAGVVGATAPRRAELIS